MLFIASASLVLGSASRHIGRGGQDETAGDQHVKTNEEKIVQRADSQGVSAQIAGPDAAVSSMDCPKTQWHFGKQRGWDWEA
ncbi:hypothetical protein B0T21DRAFT_409877 [Apiosordaria backusii]|uniref:Secreted protein n=1 Tax=Apiosordaria backusii TaxID=314023 RepID=A0AA40BSE0_9PEZI|nr:hypothetical protein B0T21DRAFT_409877 [Apiosordaria backusii]